MAYQLRPMLSRKSHQVSQTHTPQVEPNNLPFVLFLLELCRSISVPRCPMSASGSASLMLAPPASWKPGKLPCPLTCNSARTWWQSILWSDSSLQLVHKVLRLCLEQSVTQYIHKITAHTCLDGIYNQQGYAILE